VSAQLSTDTGKTTPTRLARIGESKRTIAHVWSNPAGTLAALHHAFTQFRFVFLNRYDCLVCHRYLLVFHVFFGRNYRPEKSQSGIYGPRNNDERSYRGRPNKRWEDDFPKNWRRLLKKRKEWRGLEKANVKDSLTKT
jgi:hypothetical protein